MIMKFDPIFVPLVLDGSKYLTVRRSRKEDDFIFENVLFHSKVIDQCSALHFIQIQMSYIQNFRAYGFSNFSDMLFYYQNYIKKYPVNDNEIFYTHRLWRA